LHSGAAVAVVIACNLYLGSASRVRASQCKWMPRIAHLERT